jgi:hypothetical protein
MTENRPPDYVPGYGDPDDDLDAFIERIDAALTAQFGPNHQEILGGGKTIASFFEIDDEKAK